MYVSRSLQRSIVCQNASSFTLHHRYAFDADARFVHSSLARGKEAIVENGEIEREKIGEKKMSHRVAICASFF